MTKSMKVEICELRLEGKSMRDIAQIKSCAHQSVHKFLNTLPKKDGRFERPDMDKETFLSICSDYIQGTSIAEISSVRGVSQKSIYAMFYFLNMRKPVGIRKSAYPTITDWMRKNSCTPSDMARRLNMPVSALSQILKGVRHPSFETGLAIRELTGVPFHEMFEEQLKDKGDR